MVERLMKNVNLIKWLVPGFLLIGAINLRAETVFEASFDETPPYTAGGNLPLGYGKIAYGRWYADQKEGISIVTSTENSLSVPLSLMLETGDVPEEPAKVAQVWATLGFDNVSGASLTMPLTLKCAFLATQVEGDEAHCAVLSVNGPSGSPLFSIQIGKGGTVSTRNHETTDSVGQIVSNRWYFLEILLPNTERPGASPVVNLYEVKGKEPGEKIGSLQLPELKPGAIYTAVVLSNGHPNSKIFFDDILVTTQD